MRRFKASLCLLPLLMLLAGCGPIGNKEYSMSIIYAVTAALSLLLLVVYCAATKKRDAWYLLLFTSVLVVNIGYFTLAISKSLDEALLANRLAYLGSVFLPLAMCMIILNTTYIRYAKWLPGLLLGLSIVVFLIAATPGYLPIYYQEVSFEKINGVSVLVKTYGPLHGIYMIYLLGYFSAMVITIVHATLLDKIDSVVHATILAVAVFVNIGVWLIEQLVRIDFEILSVSYIISGSFLLGLDMLMTEAKKQNPPQPGEELPKEQPQTPPAAPGVPQQGDEQAMELFLSGLATLTKKETEIYNRYVAGMTTDVIMEQLCIKENTLKFHSKNLYSKLGVRSRKQLMELHRAADAQGRLPQ